jgi:hypothetical protein
MWKILWILHGCIEICGKCYGFCMDVLKYLEKFMDFAWM